MLNAPPPPEFGQPLPVLPSPEALAMLAYRRSSSAPTLAAPGPDAGQLDDLLRLATRVPDHGKLAPWRFILLEGEDKAAFGSRLLGLAHDRDDPEKAIAALGKFNPAPLAIAVVSHVTPGHKVPEWEQVLSAGAAAFALLLAGQAMGFGSNWITDWYSFDARVAALLELGPTERLAGFVFIGTPTAAPLERVRPELPQVVRRWRAGRPEAAAS
jgi:nitroreductase